MGLVICGECRAKISQYAKKCPSCGAPCIPMSDEQYAARTVGIEAARRHDMKWWAIFVAALLFIGWLGSQSADERKAEQDGKYRDWVNSAEQRKNEKEGKEFWKGVGIDKDYSKKR